MVYLMHVFCCWAQHPPNEWNGQPLKGQVKKIKYCSGFLPGTIENMRIVSFNNNDYSVDSFNESGRIVLEYNMQNGNMVFVKFYSYRFGRNGKVTEEYEYIHNIQSNDTDFAFIAFKYDQKGHLIQQNFFLNHFNNRCVKYTYSGNRISIVEDSLIEPKAMEKTYYHYDDKRHRTKEVTFYEQGKISYESYSKIIFDDRGNKVSELDSKDPDHAKFFRYDKHDNVVFTRYGKGDDDLEFISEYYYDDIGNWIRCIEDQRKITGGHEPVYQATIRKIEYY